MDNQQPTAMWTRYFLLMVAQEGMAATKVVEVTVQTAIKVSPLRMILLEVAPGVQDGVVAVETQVQVGCQVSEVMGEMHPQCTCLSLLIRCQFSKRLQYR